MSLISLIEFDGAMRPAGGNSASRIFNREINIRLYVCTHENHIITPYKGIFSVSLYHINCIGLVTTTIITMTGKRDKEDNIFLRSLETIFLVIGLIISFKYS